MILDGLGISSDCRIIESSTQARAASALRLIDYQLSFARPRSARSDGSSSQLVRLWDFYFAEATLRIYPSNGLIEIFHYGWPGLELVRLDGTSNHRSIAAPATLSPEERQQFWLEQVLSSTSNSSIVMVRMLNEIPNPEEVLRAAVESRTSGALVIVTGLFSRLPYVYNEQTQRGSLTSEVVLGGGQFAPLMSGVETNELEAIELGSAAVGVAYGSHPVPRGGIAEYGEAMNEHILDLKCVRTLHSLDAEPWIGKPGHAFWCEWDHYGETPRTLASIVNHLQRENWPRFIKPGSVVIDIGGHSGDTAVPMGLFAYDRARGQGKVIVVEPNPAVLEVMTINLTLNAHIADFKSVPYAITERDVDEVELSDHGNANCNGGIVRGSSYSGELQDKIERSSVNRYKARGVTIETLLAECGVSDFSAVSFIKTDCEGYDKEILRGSSDFFQRYKPALFVEWFAWFSDADSADLFAAIESIGYKAYNPVNLSVANKEDRISDLLCLYGDRDP